MILGTSAREQALIAELEPLAEADGDNILEHSALGTQQS